MKVLIQEIPTSRFYQASGYWTVDIQRATNFHTASEARDFALKAKLQNVQVVLTEDFKEYQTFRLQGSIGMDNRLRA